MSNGHSECRTYFRKVCLHSILSMYRVHFSNKKQEQIMMNKNISSLSQTTCESEWNMLVSLRFGKNKTCQFYLSDTMCFKLCYKMVSTLKRNGVQRLCQKSQKSLAASLCQEPVLMGLLSFKIWLGYLFTPGNQPRKQKYLL